MDIHDVFSAVKLPGGKATTNRTQIPANIIEALVPGYSIISKVLSEHLGFDISLIVSGCVFIFGLIATGTFLWKKTFVYLRDQFTSSVTIRSDDDIYGHIMGWLAGQPISQTTRSLIATTTRGHTWDSENGYNEDDGLNSDHYLNFSNWDAKVPPTFQPNYGDHFFWHRRRLFVFSRKSKKVKSLWGDISLQNEIIQLRCIGRSTQPIKNLIQECGDHYLDKGKSCTVIRRPAHKDHRDKGHYPWVIVATRPSRPIGTVVLDHIQKDCILMDINEYLHPATSQWYANRGIPYRRGYLFHGPPGTGKSSFAWTIAGVFGLDIYCISLVERTLSDEDLALIFMNLPRRCVVLLEDIDSAGLVKRQGLDKNDILGSKITLSGLLNAIDGVASHEGRVLVMTSNFPENLDEALIRPGRIDMQVAFTNATRPQIWEIFVRMYSPDTPTSKINEKDPPATLPQSQSLTTPATPSATPKLEEIAGEFAKVFEEGTFAPAEIQGFLLTWKKDPVKALQNGPVWRDQVLKAKQAKSKMGPMQ